MAQPRKPKLSRRARGAWASTGDRELWSKLPTDIREEIDLVEGYPLRQNLLLDLVNMRDDGELWFWQRWENVIRPELGRDLFQLRAGLRHVWNKPSDGSVDIILMNWLAWRPSPAHLKRYEHSPFPPYVYPSFYSAFHCSIDAARLVPDSESIRANLIQGVFEHWPNFKTCTNPDCAAPYFIAKRKDQTVCDAEICKAEKQRQHALKWWNEREQRRRIRKKLWAKRQRKGAGQTRASESAVRAIGLSARPLTAFSKVGAWTCPKQARRKRNSCLFNRGGSLGHSLSRRSPPRISSASANGA